MRGAASQISQRPATKTIDGLTYWALGRPRSSGSRQGRVHLLPIYDEYIVAYRDLEAVPRSRAGWGILPQAIVARGQVAGTWKTYRQEGSTGD